MPALLGAEGRPLRQAQGKSFAAMTLWGQGRNADSSRLRNITELLQRSDLSGRLQSLGSVPRFTQLCSVNGGPFDDETVGAWGQSALHYRQGVDAHQCFIAPIQNVEMRRPVVIEIHAYDDSVKSAKLRHCAPACSRHDVVERLAGELQIEGVRAKLNIIIPSDGSVGREVHLFKTIWVVPGLECTAASQVGQVNLTSYSVGKLNPYPVSRTRFYMNGLNHPICFLTGFR